MASEAESGDSNSAAPVAQAPRACCGGKTFLFKKLLLTLAVLAVVLAAVVALQPAEFRVERSTTISAPPSAAFELVNDFHHWEIWSPWLEADPQAKVTFEGPSSGEGAVYRWAGNSQVGEGSATIVESRPNERILIKLEFIKPFANTCTAEFTFHPQDGQTDVTWSMSGHNDFLSKAIHLVINMDEMIGGQFAKGLAKMQSAAETAEK